jgi:hypothetical protein
VIINESSSNNEDYNYDLLINSLRQNQCKRIPREMFQKVPIIGDGSCGFRSILLGYQKVLNNDLTRSQLKIIDKLITIGDIKPAFDYLYEEHNSIRRKKLKLSSAKWIEVNEIYKLRNLYKININIYVEINNKEYCVLESYPMNKANEEHEGSINLLFKGGVHFELLIKK